MTAVLHLRSSCGLYGADRAMLELCEALAERPGLRPVVGSIVRRGIADVLGEEAQRRKLATLRIESTGRLDLAAARTLAIKLRALGIGLIHAHDYKSLSMAVLVSRFTGTPVVATYHGDTAATFALRGYEALGRVLGNATSGVSAVSVPLCHSLQSWIRTAKVHHIPNGIRAQPPCGELERADARRSFELPADAMVICAVGRLSVEKGHAVLLDALRSLPRPPWLLVAGAGPLERALKERALDLPVRWLGFVDDARPVYAACDLVVLPSLTEGLPLVALEAMALGRPLLATAVGELPSLLADGAGALCRPNDAAALARALVELLDQPVRREEQTARARQRVHEHYALERTAERIVRELYAPVLGTAGAPHPGLWGWTQARTG
jgi:glycosyltransferase involved in cell wall biosynthesis